MTSFDRTDGTLTVGFTARLPLVQEIFRRTIRMVDGESVVYIESELESLLGFDRPINWGEHATIGGPFLEQGKTVTEMSASSAQTRSYVSEAVEPPDHHNLADEKDFTWPIAPTADGGKVDVRVAPTITPVMDQTTSLMDPSRRLVFVTAFHPDKKAVFGYVFRREEYPWTQIWDSYPGGSRRSSRGMTTVWLNGQLVVDNVKMENYWDYSKPLPAKGNIELQYHGHKLYWKNIYAKDLN